ncbi:hypothetical protein [Methanolobus sp. WCC5]|jgi:stalled ribosome alternative rescue factor ArfA|uniref:hypothetical protein n=1 Tax=Methanolobus sp. WCC5 TaxID=3125785 RepID=UPI0032489D17
MTADDKRTDGINEGETAEEELEELLEKEFRKKTDPKHRGYGDYERKRIYRGPSVRRDHE